MRRFALLLLGAGTSALCQNAPCTTVNPDQLFQMPKSYVQGGRDVTQFPSGFNPAQLPGPQLVLENPKEKQKPRQIDPGIILRPRAPRTDGQHIARNLYPDLLLMPIERGSR